MKYANQQHTFEEYANWLEDVLLYFEDLLEYPDDFFPISRACDSAATEGNLIELEYFHK